MDDEASGDDRSVFDWLFRNRETGEITIAQTPNPPLWVFLAAVVLRWVLPDGGGRDALGWIGLAGLGWWAVDEVIRGVNPWRRFLGAAGCALIVWAVADRVG